MVLLCGLGVQFVRFGLGLGVLSCVCLVIRILEFEVFAFVVWRVCLDVCGMRLWLCGWWVGIRWWCFVVCL